MKASCLRNHSFGYGLFLCLILLPTMAEANAREDVFGAGAKSKAMGGATTAVVTGWSSVYHNPANLALATKSSMSLTLNQVGYDLSIDDEEVSPEPDPLHTRRTITLGMNLRLPLNLSFGAMLNFSLDRVQFFDQSTPDVMPRFHFYGQNIEQISIMLGFAYEVFDGLSLGLTLAPLVNSTLVLESDIPVEAAGQEVAMRYSWNLVPNITYYLGLHYQPSKSFRVGLVGRTEMFHKLEAPAQIMVELAGLRVPVNLLLESYAWYSPNQVALGTSFEPVEWLTLAMDLTWYQWSRYPGPYVHASADESSELARSLDYPPEIDLVFEDTLVPRVGLEASVGDNLKVRSGYRRQQSPVPSPTGRTNLLDSDTHFISAGLGYSWLPPVEDPGEPGVYTSDEPLEIMIDLYGTVGLLDNRDIDKQGSEELLNDYTFGGVVYDAGLMITARF
ncbi:MAG: outer membrane protein transport protein [Myxococcota bacterium]|nr:outer membrane protein transport protein [Myxococcota bacterium]